MNKFGSNKENIEPTKGSAPPLEAYYGLGPEDQVEDSIDNVEAKIEASNIDLALGLGLIPDESGGPARPKPSI